METKQLKRIADAIEEILRLIKKDMKTINEAARPEKRPTSTMKKKEKEEKEELIDELEGIIKANKDNIYCDRYQLQDMIEKVFKMYE